MATRVLLDAAVAMRNLGDACPSEKEWAAWKEAFILPRTLKFNISWLEDLLAEIEERRNSRRRLLPGEIAQLKEEVASIKQELKEYKATQVRLVTEAAVVSDQILMANTSLDEKERSLVEKESEFSAFP
ncbi:hypothetical protein MKW92_009685 [Papaver armeniacum]|nr:hypothetical protein MKW92_009685 [Papaver armeniacum]